MGTRGLLGLVIDNEVKATYNHYDSYPSGLGVDVIAAVESGIDLTKARALTLVNEDAKPTPDQVEALAKYANTGVSTGSTEEWYVLLRNLQGSLQGYLDAGFMIDNADFAGDSLFCEWGYLVNLDTGKIEVYRGFNKGPAKGRFANVEPEPYDEQYGPITLVAELDMFMATADDMAKIESDVYADDE